MLSDDLRLLRQQIRKYRKRKGLSQGKLELRIGKERNYITRVETGRIVPPVDVLSNIAEELEIPIGQLFSSDEADQDPKLLRKSILKLVRSADAHRSRLYYRILRAVDEESTKPRAKSS
jgi:transcriptional regulator with XRE-family HTH domain